MRIVEEIAAFGHPLIRAAHRSTFEVTRESFLTERGDCIIAVRADKAARDLSEKFKEAAKKAEVSMMIIIEAGGEREIVKAYGSPALTFTHPTDMVIRKSSYVCGKTIAIRANKAACDLSRSLVDKLRGHENQVKITLIVEG
ncbi:MAG: DUF371 domain-containing protein [Candidatus Bathyarchaeota archaeon]|nr:DUF371 domain-containing protein [Candidatus Bathyarchaeota archaeon]